MESGYNNGVLKKAHQPTIPIFFGCRVKHDSILTLFSLRAKRNVGYYGKYKVKDTKKVPVRL